jgi:hypothetical protein
MAKGKTQSLFSRLFGDGRARSGVAGNGRDSLPGSGETLFPFRVWAKIAAGRRGAHASRPSKRPSRLHADRVASRGPSPWRRGRETFDITTHLKY